MHEEGKVVPLAAAIDRGAQTPSPSLPLLLLHVRDKAALQLRQGLQALFDNADDTLFEMADKVRDRLDQNLHFEAMRDLRLKRKSIERGFLDTFYQAFALIGQADAMAAPAHSAVVQAMVDRVLSRDGFDLLQLNLRCAALLEQGLDLGEGHAESAIGDDRAQPEQVGPGVEPVARVGALAGDEQADLVVVVQGAHGDAIALRHLSDDEFGVLHDSSVLGGRVCRGHGFEVAASRRVRVKWIGWEACPLPSSRP